MKGGIANKLTATYITMIVTSIICGGFYFYVLRMNDKNNSLGTLNEMRLLMQEVKKLTNIWVYVSNKKDQERLSNIIKKDYPILSKSLHSNANELGDNSELQLLNEIEHKNAEIIDSVVKIMSLLHSSESYTNDSVVDAAASVYNNTTKKISSNDKLFAKLIETKDNPILRQKSISLLINYLYLIVVATILIIIAVSVISMRFTKRHIVTPLLNLKATVLSLAVGEVVPLNEIGRKDEIGQMYNAVSKMTNGIIEKIKFSEKIGKGKYNTEFELLSEKDVLGKALILMRDDLKKSNEIFLAQEKNLIDAQRIAKVGSWEVDLSTKRLTWSPQMYTIYNCDPATFTPSQETLKSLLHPDDLEKMSKYMAASHQGERQRPIEFRIFDGDGSIKYLVGNVELLFSEDGRPIKVVGTTQDVTESKMLELELSNSYQMATEQNKRLLNFSYIVSHNLRMHAVNIHSLLEMLVESDTEEERKDAIQFLQKASVLLNETMFHLNDVVSMQNKGNLDTEMLPLGKHIGQAIDALKTQMADKGARIINNVTGNVTINYNAAYLDSVLINLISNAIKYSHKDRQPIVTIDYYKVIEERNTKWVLQIADNGIGIDMERNRDKVFGMYKTFHGNKDAKGIGLFMTKYQIEAMGGKIEVESELNIGTTFKIYIK